MEGRLQAFATARRMAIAAAVRRPLDALLADEGEPGGGTPVIADPADDGSLVKVTLRLQASRGLDAARIWLGRSPDLVLNRARSQDSLDSGSPRIDELKAEIIGLDDVKRAGEEYMWVSAG